MVKYIYDAKTNAFYPYSNKVNYLAAGLWPETGVDFEEDGFAGWQADAAPAGKIRIAGADGMPSWADIPPLTHEQLVSAAEADKQKRIDSANAYMNSKQWPGKSAMGRLSDAEKAQYNLWLDYLDALETVDTSTAPDTTWPVQPA